MATHHPEVLSVEYGKDCAESAAGSTNTVLPEPVEEPAMYIYYNFGGFSYFWQW